ncbi:MAG TPA: biopolymer transporter ExbD [Polyangiaceae bacterium]|nr:biopolymer transporter ExbD [Polyangiaceae bacterium]
MNHPGSDRQARWRAVRTLIHGEGEGFARPPIKAEINVTPLVDVVLVLLIIFMVVTPLIASGIAVDLPRTSHHARKPDDGKDIIVSITKDERVYIGRAQVAKVDEFGAAMTVEKRRFPDKSIFVKGDARAPYGLVRKVLAQLHEAKIDDVVLGTEEAMQGEAP